MKKLFLSLLMAMIAFVASAQNIGEAFYIYRNDGGFNAFFRDEVDSIAYSNYDADSIWYDDVVTQVVYTPDSTYCIPLATIDSVSFVQPETILQPNVVLMENKGLMDYLLSVDGMTLYFKPKIPRDIRPKTNDILVSTDFDNPLFNEGFVGKVVNIEMNANSFQVVCDSVYDLFEIFEQLISIEKLGTEQMDVKPRKVKGEWTSSRNPLTFNLGYSHALSDGEVSLSGSVNGTYIATVAYNITRKKQYLNLKIHHDWQYGAHLNFKSEKSFGTLLGKVNSLPAFRFPVALPIFKFQISGSPFVKGEGNMELDFSLNSPVHSYLAEVTYLDGHFSGSNNKLPVQGSNVPSFEAAFSLNGSLQIGYMVDFWLGTINAVGSYLRTGLDFYIGPKMTGDFTMKLGTGSPNNYYSIYKDSKLGLSLLTVDYEFFGEAAIFGHRFPKGMFCNGTFQTPLYHEWYIMPEFSDLQISKNSQNKSASISTTPSRDILFPLSLGLGLYDKSNNLLSTKFNASKYKRENEGYVINQTFTSLEKEKEYEARPMIRILGGEIPANPSESFKIEGEHSCPDSNHPHWIDLGLPSGTLWRCCNEGASTPEAYGGYYTFGQVSSAPTKDQILELLNYCSYNWTTQNGVSGGKFTGPNGGTIFLPAAGYRWDGELDSVGSYGHYWSSTPLGEYYAYHLNFYSDYKRWYDYIDRDYERSVRPVR